MYGSRVTLLGTEHDKLCNVTTPSTMKELPVITTNGDRDYRLEDFEMKKTIGTGTFGRVCLCRNKLTGAYYAMKILEIADVIRLKQVEHVKNEKSILKQVVHPFIIDMLWTNHDDTSLYMLFEYVCGGELFTYLRNAGRFSSTTGAFYAAEIVLALEYLHKQQVVYRDLKPENLLLDREGHLKITDFGFAKTLTDRYPPFFDDNPFAIYEKILAGKIDWPRHIDPIAKDLIKKVLVQDRTKRLGNMKNGADDIKRHRWFKGTNWDDVLNKRIRPPITPKVKCDGDTGNFDDYPEPDNHQKSPPLSEEELDLFKEF
ncbi:cAMP-dependent protein kinase catalytic subunit 3-like isoform X4 [Tachypleus tridentatus]|uniref:cAMP-dependent protein kinase catalytic subunit 3-like isoform X4 n=1 Tax=Tachypleus tridentatus TaxID=6853 RepID=UPI003FD66ED8